MFVHTCYIIYRQFLFRLFGFHTPLMFRPGAACSLPPSIRHRLGVCGGIDATGIVPNGHGDGGCYGHTDGTARRPGHHPLQHAHW